MLGATRAYSGLFYSCLLCTVSLRVIARAVKKDTGEIINQPTDSYREDESTFPLPVLVVQSSLRYPKRANTQQDKSTNMSPSESQY